MQSNSVSEVYLLCVCVMEWHPDEMPSMEQVISYLDSAEEAVADAGYQLLRFVKGCQNRDVECDKYRVLLHTGS